MAPLNLQPDKYFGSGPETIAYSYHPSFGGDVYSNPSIIDPRILTSLKSGIQFQKLNISITNKRITFDLIMPSCRQLLEMCYQDLCRIYVTKSRKLALQDSRGLRIWLNATRPHWVAIELWVEIACQIVSHYQKIGRTQEARELIAAIDVSTLKVPDDFLSLKGEQYSNICAGLGFCLPINRPPYWRFEHLINSEQGAGPRLITSAPVVDTINPQDSGSTITNVISNATTVASATTADVIGSGAVQVSPGSVPTFRPSLAELPSTMNRMDTLEDELQWAIHNSPNYFQSFYNDQCPISSKGINDDVISGNCFDEGLYCALVKEMHRYTIAEVGANQDNIAKSNAGLGAMVGSFLGLITGNIFAPFLGHTYGKNMTDRSRRIEEFLPDPVLLFNQDPNSFLSWSRGQVSSPRLRRMILDRQVDSENRVYFRLLPAIVTADSVYPIQLFKLLPSTYFYRPLAAGIGDDSGRKQPNYDAIKIQRKYFHIRAEGEVTPTDMSLGVFGRDIEDYDVKLYRYVGHSLDYFYADFKIQPGSVF